MVSIHPSNNYVPPIVYTSSCQCLKKDLLDEFEIFYKNCLGQMLWKNGHQVGGAWWYYLKTVDNLPKKDLFNLAFFCESIDLIIGRANLWRLQPSYLYGTIG